MSWIHTRTHTHGVDPSLYLVVRLLSLTPSIASGDRPIIIPVKDIVSTDS